jgi:hypothetical protein
MSMAGSFLGGAKNRLLPASVPFSFFLAAAGFQILAWAALLAGAATLAGYTGGTGPVLAAIHLLTLGVLALTAMGASYQLLPVVTRQPLALVWPARLSFWLVAPGVVMLATGMTATNQMGLSTGAGLVTGGLLVFAFLTGLNLLRAGSLPVVAAHGWGALIALLGLLGVALALVANINLGFLANPDELALVHLVLAVFGFMGLLVLGLSLVLIPMFVMSRSVAMPVGWAQLALVVVALALFVTGILADAPGLSALAFIPGAGAGVAYFWLMRAALRNSMRKRLGLSFLLIRLSWGLLGLGLLIGFAVWQGWPVPNGPALFGFVTLAGWLLTFLTGVLQRIMPFLASMHASGRAGLPLLLSDLTAETPLRVHAICHLSALGLVSLGIVLNLTILVQFGAATGMAGAIAFAVFAINVVVTMNAPHDSA